MIEPSGSTQGRAPTTHIDDLVSAVLTASRVLVGVSAVSLAETEGTVTLAQYRTLVVLDSRGDCTPSRLAELLGVNSAAVTRLVDRLVAAGLVTRDESSGNRRDVVVGLSRAGAELVWRVTDKRRAEIARIVRRMPTGQRDELVAALTAFADAAGEPQPRGVAAVFGW